MGELFSAYDTRVPPEWVDYNGHMHDASYAIALSDANEELFRTLDLSEDYRARSGAAFYTVETHLRYVAECSRGQTLTASTILVEADDKRLRLHSELYADGVLAATAESLYLHVDTTTGRVAPLPADRRARVEAMRVAQAGLPRPTHLGLGVGTRP